MNRYDHGFRTLPAFIRANAGQKVSAARGALFQSRSDGFGVREDEAVVRQFDLSGMAEFWAVELSEPISCDAFVRALALHFLVIEDNLGLTDDERKRLSPAALRVVGGVEGGIRRALREARTNGEPWFIQIPERPPSSKLDHPYRWVNVPGQPEPVIARIIPPDPPSDGIDLSKLRVRPREAVTWMMANPKRCHLVPPSLVAVLRPASVATRSASTPSLGHPRRRGPKAEVGPRVEAEMRDAIARGVDLGAMKQAEMAAQFKAAQSVCRDIRKAILGETGGN